MMMRWIYIAFCMLAVQFVFGQQQERSNTFFLLPATYNPAYATDVDRSELFLHYSQQLAGVPGGPVSQGAQLFLPFKQDTMGFGIGFRHEQLNVMENMKASAIYAYEKQFGAKHAVQLAVDLQVINQRLDFEKIRANESEESSLLNQGARAMSFNFGLGLAYTYDKLSLGIVADQLRESNVLFSSPEDQKQLNFQYIRHFMVHGSYQIDLSTVPLAIQPLIALRSTQGVPLSWELGSAFTYKEQFWLALSYWHGSGVKTGVGVNVLKQLNVGYQFGLPTSQIAKISNGSHEVVLRFSMSRPNKEKKDTTKFEPLPAVDTSEAIAAHRNEEIWEELQRFENEEREERLKYMSLIEKEKEEIAQLQMDLREMQEEFELDITELEHDVDSLSKVPHGLATPVSKEPQTNDTRPSTPPVKNRVAKPKMKIVGYYVVVGEFKYEENADRYVDYYASTYKAETAYKSSVQTSSGKIYFIAHTLETTDYEQAKKEVARVNALDKLKIVDGGAWICKKREYSW